MKIIVTDLDGTLIKSDILFDSILKFLKINIFNFFVLLAWLLKGKAYTKKKLASELMPNIKKLPYNESLILNLKVLKKNKNYHLVLATATHETVANKIATHLNIFDEVIATSGNINMSGINKKHELNKRFGEKCYTYYGNSSDDFPVWDSANEVCVVNANPSILKKCLSRYNVKEVMKKEMSLFSAFIKSIRVHQWMKNTLLFVPLLASHQISNISMITAGLIAYIAFSLCASSVYLLNDMLDIEEDRKHQTKKNRPIASGDFSIVHAVISVALLLITSLAISYLFLPSEFIIVLGIYYLMTLAYSFGLKKIVMLDVVVLALLYTIRVIAGASAMLLTSTFWILAFSMFIFLSLAFVKRYVELNDLRKTTDKATPGRGYYSTDFELLSSLGTAAGYISVMVLALYINDFNPELYSNPKILWLACPLLMYWLSRVWLLAHRGEMHDDPVVFAIKDKTSRIVGLLFISIFICASFL